VETEVLDYVHEYITVEPSDARLLDLGFVEAQLQRLQRLQHLGLISKIYRLARHDKLEHAYGTYWLCKRIEESNSKLRVNGKALRFAGILHSIGHLPFSYATEHIVLQLYHIHFSTKNWLDGIFKECIDFVGEPNLQEASADLLKRNDSYMLYRWFSAVKVARSHNNATADLFKQVVHHLIDPGLFGHRLLRELDCIDYVLRDLLYLGRGRIELTMTPFLAQFRRGPEDMLYKPALFKIIDAARNSLNEEVYMDGRVRSLEQVVGKALLSEVVEGHLTIDQLFDMDDKEFEERLRNFRIQPIDVDDLVTRIEGKEIIEVARIKCYGGLLIEREARIAGTNKLGLHKYPGKKGIYIECLPFWDKTEANLLSVGIVYDYDAKHIESLISAFIRAEEWLPDSPDSIELSYREEVFRCILGLSIFPQFERLADAVRHTVVLQMKKAWGEMKDLPAEGRGDKVKLWHQKWDMREWADFEVDLSEKPDDWLADHFIQFPEHFHTERIESILDSIQRSKRRKGETLEKYAQRQEKILECESYLRAILKMRSDSRVGWVLPCVKLLDESGNERNEIDCISISIRDPYKGLARLELKAVSRDTSSTKELEEQRKLEMVVHQIRERFPRGIDLVAMFNDKELFR